MEEFWYMQYWTMALTKKRNSYTRGFQSDNPKKYIEGKESNI